MTDMVHQLHGYRRTRAEIIHRLLDHLSMSQTYVWQSLDLAPQFPELWKFLDFWNCEIEGLIPSVKVVGTHVIKPPCTRVIKHSLTIH